MKAKIKNPKGSGRKPFKDPAQKKVPMFVYLPGNLIQLAGGKEAVKAMLEAHFEGIGKKLLK